MQQDPDQAEKEDEKASTGGMSILDFNFLSDFENGTDMLEATTEPAELPRWNRNLPESSSLSNSRIV